MGYLCGALCGSVARVIGIEEKIMKLFKVLRGLAVACGVIAAAGSAQAVEPPETFNGGYAGLVSGYGIGDGNFTRGNIAPPNRDLDLEGPLAGITAGINFRSGSVLYGLEGDAQVLGLSDESPCGFAPGNCNVDVDAMITARGRLGWIFGTADQFAFYATGGLAALWVDVTADGGGAPRFNNTEVTYAVGGGFEGYVMDTNWISTKIEALYVGDIGYNRSFLGPGATSGPDSVSIDDFFFVRWGWNIHF